MCTVAYLENLAAAGAMLIVAPMTIQFGSGRPARLLAILPQARAVALHW